MGLSSDKENTSAWYVMPVKIQPVIGDGFIGEVNQGPSVSFNNISFNPHGNGTHTECVGHISKEFYSINQQLKTFFFDALLISVLPMYCFKEELGRKSGDTVITLEQIKQLIGPKRPQGIVIRTLPNSKDKLTKNYSNSNPTYLCHLAAKYIREIGIEHLLIDLPSVDRELDEGQLLAHRAFWNFPENTQFQNTITELIYVSEEVKDGDYLLNLQIASFENDATPSKPVLYELI